jgi:hypothetical protein
LVEFENDFANQGVNEDFSLDIFEMIVNTNEPTRKVVNRKLVIFKQYQVDVKNIKCFFNGGKM